MPISWRPDGRTLSDILTTPHLAILSALWEKEKIKVEGSQAQKWCPWHLFLCWHPFKCLSGDLCFLFHIVFIPCVPFSLASSENSLLQPTDSIECSHQADQPPSLLPLPALAPIPEFTFLDQFLWVSHCVPRGFLPLRLPTLPTPHTSSLPNLFLFHPVSNGKFWSDSASSPPGATYL